MTQIDTDFDMRGLISFLAMRQFLAAANSAPMQFFLGYRFRAGRANISCGLEVSIRYVGSLLG
jgi:hypothetical protein